jgi:DNA-binding NtrC family response regulator
MAGMGRGEVAARGVARNTTEERALVRHAGPHRPPTLSLVYSGDEVRLPPVALELSRGPTSIGRDATSGIPLIGDRRASRHHATVHMGPTGTLRVVDEDSRNGTLINGRRVEQAMLSDGDVLAIGDSYFIVRDGPAGVADTQISSLLGAAPCMRRLRSAIGRVGPTDATVLVLAESGCGKELVSRALHDVGGRGGPFVAVNCSAIPESLAESTLFGHAAGAFSGAVARAGLFRAAHGGTLFLDEVGELPEAVQPKLLRVLQDRMVLPVGESRPVACDVRIVAATNRDLRGAIAERRFRGDLYARLAEHILDIAPLRERREDILLLLLHALGAPAPRLTPALVEALLLHPFPFNVRELEAVASQLRICASPYDAFDLSLVEDRLRSAPPTLPHASHPSNAGGICDAVQPAGIARSPDATDERQLPPDRAQLEALLRAHRGVIADIARAMQRSRKQVYRWLGQHDLDIERFRGP